MAKTQKKKPAKKTGKSSSSGGGVLIAIIALVIIGAFVYGMYFKSGSTGLPSISEVFKSEPVEKKAAEENTTEKKTEPKPSKEIRYEENEEDEINDEIIEPTKISSSDGKTEKAATNKNLPKYTEENPYYFTSSFDFAWPAYTNSDQIIEHSFYTLRYNEKMEQADWVAYKLTAKNLSNTQFKRTDNFREDPMVKTKSADPMDYKGSGYDRGHLAPAADFTWNKSALDETFFMSNMSPQLPGFNRGVWAELEEKTRGFAKSNNEIFIVTGPIFKEKNEKIGKGKVAVPSQFFKVIIELRGNDTKGIAFLLNNESSDAALSTFVLSIDDLETKTGLDFFPGIPDELENKIECCAKYSSW